MTRQEKLFRARNLVWRNLPSGVSTFSSCECGRGAGRGGGPCLICAEESLADLVGTEAASLYVATVKSLRALEREQDELVSKP